MQNENTINKNIINRKEELLKEIEALLTYKPKEKAPLLTLHLS